MQKLPILLSLAIVDLASSNYLFNGQQYFSFLASLGLILLGALAAILFALPSVYHRHTARFEKYMGGALPILVVSSLLLILYELVFSFAGVQGLSAVASAETLAVLVFAVLISVAGMYLIGKVMEGRSVIRAQLSLLFGALVVSLLIYAIIIGTSTSIGHSDELAYNYYSAGLLLKGQNPYTASMQPALSLYYNSRGTVWLNGSIEDRYIYPAFSFIYLALLPPIFGFSSILPVYWLTIFLVCTAALVVYTHANKNAAVLLPLGVWLFTAYSLISFISSYLAVSVFLLLAYIYRRRPLFSGMLVGLSAGTTQFAWFAIPFLIVLALRELGARHAYKQLAIALLTFLLINGYFLAIHPSQMLNSLFGAFSSLPIAGPNIVQLLVGGYPIPYSYSMFAFVLVYLTLLLMFYLRTDSLRPLMGVVPFLIFFLSWRNLLGYDLPLIPYILATAYYGAAKSKIADIEISKKVFIYAPPAVLLVLLAVLIYAHGTYVQSNNLYISNVSLSLSQQGGVVVLGGIEIYVYNGASVARNLSFYIYASNPGQFVSSPGYLPNSTVAANSRGSFGVPFMLQGVSNSTQLFIIAFSNGSITSRLVKIRFG